MRGARTERMRSMPCSSGCPLKHLMTNPIQVFQQVLTGLTPPSQPANQKPAPETVWLKTELSAVAPIGGFPFMILVKRVAGVSGEVAAVTPPVPSAGPHWGPYQKVVKNHNTRNSIELFQVWK